MTIFWYSSGICIGIGIELDPSIGIGISMEVHTSIGNRISLHLCIGIGILVSVEHKVDAGTQFYRINGKLIRQQYNKGGNFVPPP